MRLRQEGFAVLETVLILVVVGIIGFTGWYVWQSKQSTDNAISQTGNSSADINNAGDKQPSTVETATYTLPVEKLKFSYDPALWQITDKLSGEHESPCGGTETYDYVTMKNQSFQLNLGVNNVGCGKGGGDCNDGVDCVIETKNISSVKVSDTQTYHLLARKISTDNKHTWTYSVFLYDKPSCDSAFCFVDVKTKDTFNEPYTSQWGGSYTNDGSGGAKTLDDYVKQSEVEAAINVLKTVHYYEAT